MKHFGAVSIGVGLVAVLVGYIAYDQHQKSLRREYYDALAAYKGYLRNQQQTDQSEDRAFEVEADKKARAAYLTGGQFGVNESRAKSAEENRTRILNRRKKRLEDKLDQPPPPEWVRFQKAAKDAAMPLTTD